MKNFHLLSLSILLFLINACIPSDDEQAPMNTACDTLVRHNYGTENRQQLDLYRPADSDENTPIVLLIHGGAWVLGPNDNASVTEFNGSGFLSWDLVTPLLEEGYACATMTYRLACYNTVPGNYSGAASFYMDQMKEDVGAAVDFLTNPENNLCLSTEQIAILGESAGANIAFNYTLQSTSNTKIKTLIGFYTPTLLNDAEFLESVTQPEFNLAPVLSPQYVSKRSENCNMKTNVSINLFFALKSLVGNNLDADNIDSQFTDPVSPAIATNVQRDLPVFMLHGLDDQLVPHSQTDKMMEQFELVNNATTCPEDSFSCDYKSKKYEGCNHGWAGNCDKLQIINDVKSWLSNHLQ